MKYEEIVKELKAGKFRPIYFLMGEEAYFIDRVARLIEQTALPEDQRSFNQSVLYGKETDVRTVVAEARRYPMMADRVVVSVREAQHLRKVEDLEAYAASPTPSTVLVISYKYKKLDKRTKLYKLLSNGSVVLESKKLYDNQIPDWVGQALRERGYTATMKAQQLIAESLGTDLGRIDKELQKLELVLKHGDEVDELMVEQNIGISKDYNNFELQKAVGAKDFVKMMQIQRYFEANPKDNPLVVTVSLLFAFFTKLMLLHQAKDKTPKGLASLLRINPFFVKEYQMAAHNYDMKSLARCIGYLRECDRRSKGVGNASVPDSELLKELLYKITYA